MADFIRPIAGTPPISDDFNEHVARKSVNPGTDYAVGRGTPVRAPANGVVKIADTGVGGAAGRSIVVYFDNGWSGDFLHLQSLAVANGARVTQGQIIGHSGASANGSDSGVGAHLHFTLRTKQTTGYSNQGNVDPELHYGGPMSATQRQVKPEGPEVLRRVTPDRSQPDIDPDLQPGEIGNFNGWIRGEDVGGNAVWYRGISGNWFWSGGFTSADPTGLEDLNPKPPTDLTKRVVLATAPANYRSAANTGATVLGSYPAGSTQQFAFWITGQVVSGNDLWYVTADQAQFSWSGGYTAQEKAGLTELPSVPIPPDVWPAEPYDFTVAGPFVTRKAPAHWSNFENEYSVPNPAERKGFPVFPVAVVDHQWGNPGAYTISSVITTFQGRHDLPANRVSAHFVVNADEIVQMVALDARAYHAGSGGNDYVGIEIDPYVSERAADGELTERAEKIIANVRKVLEFLRDRNGGVALENKLHRDIPGAATSCGTWIAPILDKIDVSQPEPPDPPDPDPSYKEQLDRIEAKIDALSKHLGVT